MIIPAFPDDTNDVGVCTDLLERSPEPLLLSFGLEDKDLDEDVLSEINTVGGMGVKLIEELNYYYINVT